VVLCAAGCNHDDNKATTMKYLPTAQLVSEIENANTTPRSGTITSSPIPVLREHRLLIAVFQADAGYDPAARGSVLSPPTRVTFFDPVTGARVSEEPRPGGSPLGTEPFDVPRSEYRQLSAQLFGAYDVLLPAFAQGLVTADPTVHAAATTFKKVFSRFSGKLLDPYYHAIGKDWFAWIDSMAGA
jgi:hypothetical protein